MEQIFIKVINERGYIIHKDINLTTESERLTFYNSMSKGEVVGMVEKLLENLGGK